MYLSGLGTAVPPHRFTQLECWTALLRKVPSGENGISTHHMVMTNWDEAFVLTPDLLHARFARPAPALATHAEGVRRLRLD